MSASTAPSRAVAQQASPTTTLRMLLDQRRTEGRALSLDEAIAIIVPLCLDLKERHAGGERLFVHASCIGSGADGLARLIPSLALVPTNARDRASLAPELQQRLEPGGARASVFAVGAVLYEAVTGSAVGPGMRRPREVDPRLPAALESLLSKALVGDPSHRPDDLGALASAMHHLAPMKSIHPPEVDQSTLDKTDEFEVDIKLSLLPPQDMLLNIPIPPPPSSKIGRASCRERVLWYV